VQDEVPTQAMRNADFSAEGVTIIDPITGAPFANDAIPSSRLNPVGQKFLNLFPLPNTGGLTTFPRGQLRRQPRFELSLGPIRCA
jgi:hypothetical protein